VSLFTMSFSVTILKTWSMSTLCLLSSRIIMSSSLSLFFSSYVAPSSPDTIATALFWTFPEVFLSCCVRGLQVCTANSKGGLIYCLSSWWICGGLCSGRP
jgi:hypothetical protein